MNKDFCCSSDSCSDCEHWMQFAYVFMETNPTDKPAYVPNFVSTYCRCAGVSKEDTDDGCHCKD